VFTFANDALRQNPNSQSFRVLERILAFEKVELSEQLSNHEIREEIHAIWYMTRGNLGWRPRVRNWQRDHPTDTSVKYSLPLFGRAFWTTDKPPNAESGAASIAKLEGFGVPRLGVLGYAEPSHRAVASSRRARDCCLPASSTSGTF
jgi:hypothetical protein